MFSRLAASVGDVEVRRAAWPGFVCQRVAELGRGHVALDVPQHEVERGETLLPVDEFPAAVFEPLHHDRLEVVVPATGILDVVEEPPDLVLAPAVAALVVAHEEGALDVADQAWFKKRRAPGVHGARHPASGRVDLANVSSGEDRDSRLPRLEATADPGGLVRGKCPPLPAREEPVLVGLEPTPTTPLDDEHASRATRRALSQVARSESPGVR